MLDVGGQMTLAAVIQAAASVLGFAFIVWQIQLVIRGLRGATQDRLYGHYNEALKLLMSKPYLYPYFYERKEFTGNTPEHPNLRAEIDIVSETILGIVEHARIQMHNLGKESWFGCWHPYFKERWDKSIELQRFFGPHESWYTGVLRDEVNLLRNRTNM